MTAQTIQNKAMHERIFGELEFDLTRALKLVNIKPENIEKAENFISFFIYHQVKYSGIDFSVKKDASAMQPLLNALRSKRLLGEFEYLSGAIELEFKNIFQGNNTEKLLNYISDKFMDILMEHEIIDYDDAIVKRVLDFEYPDIMLSEKNADVKTDC